MKDKITQIKSFLQTLSSNQQVANDLDYYTFLATLLPVPGFQQAALLVNKLLGNHNLNLLITDLQESIYSTNTRITLIEDEVEKVQQMARTVSAVSVLEEKIDLIIEEAKKELPSEFIVETNNWSTQAVINQIINADYTAISANNNSHNHFENVEITSRSTHLRATNHSSNFLRGTDFKDATGAVSMNGITQQGNIHVTSNSIGFGDGGTLIFGNPNEVNGNCPNCNTYIVVDKNHLQNYSSIKCPECKGIFPYRIT